MSRIVQLVFVLAFLAAAAAPAVAQQSAPDPLAQMDGKNILTRIDVMLAHRQQLRLSAEQVAALEQIKRDYEAANTPLYLEAQKRLKERPAGSESLAELRERPDLNPIFESMRSNNMATANKLRAALSEEQIELGNHYFRTSQQQARERATRQP